MQTAAPIQQTGRPATPHTMPDRPAPPWAGWVADVLLVVGCAVVAGLLEQDANWDQLQYHYWYPWQWFNGGFQDPDLFGGRFQNPLPQVPFYLAVTFLPPLAAQAALGGLNGVMLVLVRRIALRVLPYRGWTALGMGVLAALLAAAGAGFRSELGTSYSDVLVTILILGGLLLLLRAAPAGPTLMAGALAGAAVGAKYTAAPFALASLAALLCLPGKRWTRTGWWALGGAGGTALTGGWWSWQLWGTYGSPMFPFWNSVFGSPLYPDRTLTDERYGVHSLGEAVALPWELAVGRAPVLDLPVRDGRWLVLLALGALALIVWLGRGRSRPRPTSLALVTFTAVGMLSWLAVFGVLRYAIPGEAVAGILLLLALSVLLPDRAAWVAASGCLALAATAVWTQSAESRRIPFGPQWWTVDTAPLAQVGPGDEVIVDGEHPSTFVLPGALADGVEVHVVQRDFLGTPLQNWLEGDLSAADRVWVVTDRRGTSQVNGFVGTIDYQRCQRIRTNVVPRWLCPLKLPSR